MQFEKILGNKNKILQVRKMIDSKKFPQNILLTGIAGIGKIEIGKIISQALLCKNSIDGNPCGECESCHAFENFTHPDFHMIEPDISKANAVIKIDTVRNLQDEISRRPTLSELHIVLIDQAETMNDAAQNSLLKTLEEPTSQIHFILVTSVKSKLLQTIKSRCTSINFNPLSATDIEKILQTGGMNSTDAKNFSSLGDGSVGNAIAIKNMSDESKIDLRADVIDFLRELSNVKDDLFVFERGKSLSENTASNKTQFVLWWLFCMKMLLRDLLFFEFQPPIYYPDLEFELNQLSEQFSINEIYTLMKITTETQRRILTSNVNLRLSLENFFIRMYKLRGF